MTERNEWSVWFRILIYAYVKINKKKYLFFVLYWGHM